MVNALITPATYSLIVRTAMNQNQDPSDEELADFLNVIPIPDVQDACIELGKKDADFGNQVTPAATKGYTLAHCARTVTTADNELYPVNYIYTAMGATAYDATTGKVTDDTPTRVFTSVLEANYFMAPLLASTGCHVPIDQALWESLTFNLTAADLVSISRMCYYYYVTAPAAVLEDPTTSVIAELRAAYVTAAAAEDDLPKPNWSTTDSAVTDGEKEAISRFIALVGTGGDTIAASKLRDGEFSLAVIAAVSPDVNIIGSIKNALLLTAAQVASLVGTNDIGDDVIASPTPFVLVTALQGLNSGTGPKHPRIAILLALNKLGFTDEEIELFIAANAGTYATALLLTDLASSRSYFANKSLLSRLLKFRFLKGLAPDGAFLKQNEPVLNIFSTIMENAEFIIPGQPPAVATKPFAIPLLATVPGQIISNDDNQKLSVIFYIVNQVSTGNTDPLVYGAPTITLDAFINADSSTYAPLLAKAFYVDTTLNIVSKITGIDFLTVFTNPLIRALIIDKLITESSKRLAFLLKNNNPADEAAVLLFIKNLLNNGVTVAELLAQALGPWSRNNPPSLMLVKLLNSDNTNGFGNKAIVEALLAYIDINLADFRNDTATLTDIEMANFIKFLIIKNNKADYANLLPMFVSTLPRKLALFKLVAESIDNEQVSALRGMVNSFTIPDIVTTFGAFGPAFDSGLVEAPAAAATTAAERLIELFIAKAGIEKLRENGVPVLYLLTYTRDQPVVNTATGIFKALPRKTLLFKISDLNQVYPLEEVEKALNILYAADNSPTNN